MYFLKKIIHILNLKICIPFTKCWLIKKKLRKKSYYNHYYYYIKKYFSIKFIVATFTQHS